MQTLTIPDGFDFDGERFGAKYKLRREDFYRVGDALYVNSEVLIDISDCSTATSYKMTVSRYAFQLGKSSDSLQEREYALWYHINTKLDIMRTSNGFDSNGMARALAWKSDPDCPAWRMERINAVLAWGDEHWMEYYKLKAQVNAGIDVDLPTDFSAPPWTFANLLSEKAPESVIFTDPPEK